MTEWLIPCSPSIYDAESAFTEYGSIIWHQQCHMNIGDIAYIYVTSPVKEIRCKCVITAVDIPEDVGDDDGYVIDEAFCSKAYRKYMQLKLVERYQPCYLLGFHFLLQNGLVGSIRSQRRVPSGLSEYIKGITALDSVKCNC